MELAVDGTVTTVAADATIREILDKVRFNIFKANRVITAIRLDGADLAREREQEHSGSLASSFQRMEIVTACPYELSIATLKEIRPNLDSLEQRHLDAARLITEGKGGEALKILNGCFAAWDEILRCLKNISLVTKVDLTTIESPGGPVGEQIAKLGGVLNNFKTAFTTRDIVRIRDVTQYELHPLIGEWVGAIDAIAEHLKKRSADGRIRTG